AEGGMVSNGARTEEGFAEVASEGIHGVEFFVWQGGQGVLVEEIFFAGADDLAVFEEDEIPDGGKIAPIFKGAQDGGEGVVAGAVYDCIYISAADDGFILIAGEIASPDDFDAGVFLSYSLCDGDGL